MPKDVFIVNREYTFQESTHILTRAISSIVDNNDETIFSMADILCMLDSVNGRVPSERVNFFSILGTQLYRRYQNSEHWDFLRTLLRNGVACHSSSENAEIAMV